MKIRAKVKMNVSEWSLMGFAVIQWQNLYCQHSATDGAANLVLRGAKSLSHFAICKPNGAIAAER